MGKLIYWLNATATVLVPGPHGEPAGGLFDEGTAFEKQVIVESLLRGNTLLQTYILNACKM